VCAYVDGSFGTQCNMAINGGTSADTATAVTQYNGTSGDDFSIWGTDSAGNDFCCTWNHSQANITGVWLLGGSGVSTLYLNYNSGAENLSYLSNSYLTMEGRVEGRAGADIIHGSYTDSTDYSDVLRGGAGGRCRSRIRWRQRNRLRRLLCGRPQ
jgi:hypothetical protein